MILPGDRGIVDVVKNNAYNLDMLPVVDNLIVGNKPVETLSRVELIAAIYAFARIARSLEIKLERLRP